MAKNGQHGIPLRSLEARVACPEVPPNQRQSQQQQRFHADTMTSGTRHPTREQRSLEFRFAYHRGEDCPGKGGLKTLRQTWWALIGSRLRALRVRARRGEVVAQRVSKDPSFPELSQQKRYPLDGCNPQMSLVLRGWWWNCPDC